MVTFKNYQFTIVKKKTLLHILIVFSLAAGATAYGEAGCSGATYTNSNCDDACAQSACQDVSFNQDGSLFQCCPPGASTPELPPGFNFLYLALGLVILLGWKKRAILFRPGSGKKA